MSEISQIITSLQKLSKGEHSHLSFDLVSRLEEALEDPRTKEALKLCIGSVFGGLVVLSCKFSEIDSVVADLVKYLCVEGVDFVQVLVQQFQSSSEETFIAKLLYLSNKAFDSVMYT